MSDFDTARRNMVDGQLRPNKVTDARILDAMSDLPRETFAAKARQGIAYVDEDIEVAPGRYLMEPVVLARLVQALELTRDDSVLMIGAGTGYDAALAGRLAGAVVAVESDRVLADQASMVINHLGVDNVVMVEGPLNEGYAAQAPYDAVFFCGAVPEIPGEITDQLVVGGRLVAVVGGAEEGVLGRAQLMTRLETGMSGRFLFDAGTRPLPGFEKAPAFVF
jgi:protein-L-isoaspartate(D-aspartate) O-methyltransferase